jgi:hypothetical protein
MKTNVRRLSRSVTGYLEYSLGGRVPTEEPTILLANRSRPVVQPTDPLAIGPAYSSSYVILHCLVNGLPHWATGYLVRQQVGLWMNVRGPHAPPAGNVHRGLLGLVRVPLRLLAPGPNCW